MNKEGEGFDHLRQIFPRIIEGNIPQEIFVGTQVQQLLEGPTSNIN